jgi:biotin operon repressor
MVMGDLVLTQEEVGPVMQRLQDSGVEQTAVHNHLLMESPRVMYMHITAHGDETKIAQAIHDALALSKTPLVAPGAQIAIGIDLDTAAITRELGVAGKVNGAVYQISVPRREIITESGHEVPPSMGVATAINFQPTGAAKAAITGDFVLLASEVNRVIRALRSNGIAVTAVHSHMIDEEPRLFFMHFWANDDVAKLSRGLRAALNQTASHM